MSLITPSSGIPLPSSTITVPPVGVIPVQTTSLLDDPEFFVILNATEFTIEDFDGIAVDISISNVDLSEFSSSETPTTPKFTLDVNEGNSKEIFPEFAFDVQSKNAPQQLPVEALSIETSTGNLDFSKVNQDEEYTQDNFTKIRFEFHGGRKNALKSYSNKPAKEILSPALNAITSQRLNSKSAQDNILNTVPINKLIPPSQQRQPSIKGLTLSNYDQSNNLLSINTGIPLPVIQNNQRSSKLNSVPERVFTQPSSVGVPLPQVQNMPSADDTTEFQLSSTGVPLREAENLPSVDANIRSQRPTKIEVPLPPPLMSGPLRNADIIQSMSSIDDFDFFTSRPVVELLKLSNTQVTKQDVLLDTNDGSLRQSSFEDLVANVPTLESLKTSKGLHSGIEKGREEVAEKANPNNEGKTLSQKITNSHTGELMRSLSPSPQESSPRTEPQLAAVNIPQNATASIVLVLLSSLANAVYSPSLLGHHPALWRIPGYSSPYFGNPDFPPLAVPQGFQNSVSRSSILSEFTTACSEKDSGPPSCAENGTSYCHDDLEYPSEEIGKAFKENSANQNNAEVVSQGTNLQMTRLPIHQLSDVDNSYFNHEVDLSYLIGSQGYLCPSKVEYPALKRAKNTKGQWRVIVNTVENFSQTVRIETCLHESTPPCRLMALCYRSKCLQRHSFYHLLSFDPCTPDRGLFVDVYRLPSACSCYAPSIALPIA